MLRRKHPGKNRPKESQDRLWHRVLLSSLPRMVPRRIRNLALSITNDKSLNLCETRSFYLPTCFLGLIRLNMVLMEMWKNSSWTDKALHLLSWKVELKTLETIISINLNINYENSPPNAMKTNHWTTTEQTILLLRFRQTIEWLTKMHYWSQLYFTQYLTIHRAHSFCP